MFKKIVIFILLLVLVISISLFAAYRFLEPFLKEKLLDAVQNSLGKKIEFSEFDINFFEGSIFLKDFKVEDPKIIEYYSSALADEIILDLDLPITILRRKPVFEEISVKDFVFRLNNKKRTPSPPIEVTLSSGETRQPKAPGPLINSIYIEKLTIHNSKFIFEDYSVTPPNIMEFIDINGNLKDISISAGEKGIFEGTVFLAGRLNSAYEGSLKIDGSFKKGADGLDFNLKANFNDVNLTKFSQYYAKTSFTILKEAKLDLHSEAFCEHDRLNAFQKACIYDITLNNITPTDKDVLFGLPAKTVIDFFNNLKGRVEFEFKIVGTISDPKFEPGPIIEKVLTKALHDKILARLRELPREVIKMGEKAVKEGLEGEKKFEDVVEEKLKEAEKKLKKIIEY